jgi:hypothetical protein
VRFTEINLFGVNAVPNLDDGLVSADERGRTLGGRFATAIERDF